VSVTVTRIPLSGGFGKVNAYLLRGEDGFVLVDTGSHGGRRTLEAGLDAAGWARSGARSARTATPSRAAGRGRAAGTRTR
jgi:Metallo-beta-lactamase superfamily